MFGSIGGFEMLVLMAIGLLVFGPRKLPEIGRTLGKALVEFRKAGMELKNSIEREVNLEELNELKESGRAVGREVSAGIDSVKQGLGGLGTVEPPGPANGAEGGDGGGGDVAKKD